MKTIAVIFWISAFIVFYTYIGYGIVLWIAVKIKETLKGRKTVPSVEDGRWPEVTLVIAAYNEEAVVEEKMRNCRSLIYPEGRLRIAWVTDGSTDRMVDMLSEYREVRVLHSPDRRGKTAALNRSIAFIETPIVIYTDANTMLNPEAVTEIARLFADSEVGCVAGEKRVVSSEGSAAATEGVYWKYESKLKELDDRLCTAVGAAGELFAVRRDLYEIMPSDTLLDDFIISMKIAQKGYKIAYCRTAYAMETPSADMHEEGKRKMRIAAGGLQSVWRLRALLNIFRYGVMSWQYISHRVLRWTLTPVLMLALIPLNIALVAGDGDSRILYAVILVMQALFYAAGIAGWTLSSKGKNSRLLNIPYYFLFMNVNVFRGARYLWRNKGRGAWEKAKRG